MDSPDKTFSDIVGALKSWIPWRSEPPSVSQAFWMPDQSCRVCYECDSQFTVFNRRHHCRLCGRIFCAKCTTNSIPVPSTDSRITQDEWEKIRVCNYCFKQWHQGVSNFNNVIQVPISDHSSSPSAASSASTKSSYSASSNSSFTIGSMPYSVGPYQRAHSSSGPSLAQTSEMERNLVNEGEVVLKRSDELVADAQYQSPGQYTFPMNRSDDDDEDDYGIYHSDSETRNFPQISHYYPQVEFDLTHDDGPQKACLEGEAIKSKILSSLPLNDNCGSQDLGEVPPIGKNDESNVDDACEAPTSMYRGEEGNTEFVDFEDNGLLWLPPEPEDEEDEKEGGLFDDNDNDEGDAAGEWGCLRASSSFGSGEIRNRDRSSEEHKNAMKNVVEGHFRALIAQLLQVENVPLGDENHKESWLEIVTSLSWEVATLLKPDMSKSGGMDPGGYVKVKCIASGHPCDSVVVKGVVCKKNVAHRRMTAKIEKPRLLILGGALEYQRVSNYLSSFDTLIQQEMDHLKMAVAKISAHHPDVLLVEKSVSRFAQEYLLAKDISLVLNIKGPLLERISRCTGAQIVPSIDHLSSSIDHLSSPKLGYCETFHVEKFFEDLGTAVQGGKRAVKTLMYFEGCPKPLGFTILLRGANGDELKKVKHVVQYGVFAAYHLAVETSFLADEGASLPELPLKAPINVALPDKSSTVERSISIVPGFMVPANEKQQGLQMSGEPQRANIVPTAYLASRIDSLEGKVLTDGPSSQASELTSSCPDCTHSLSSVAHNGMAATSNHLAVTSSGHLEEVVANHSQNGDSEMAAIQQHSSEVLAIQSDGSNNFEEVGPPKEEFSPSPSDHQSILVSLSSRCVGKGTVCERSHLFRIKYYGSFDKPLGWFLRDHLFDQNYSCRSCEMPSEAHVHCYTHLQGSLTISVTKLPEILLPGEKDGKIWMWHRCLKCPRTNGFPPATRRVVMSNAAWGLSLGKFLELSFSNHAAASRVASCGHSLHRDCLRFYGLGKMVACFRYASINVLSVCLPPQKLDFNFENQEWVQKETEEVVNQTELLFSDVLNALSQVADNRPGGMKPETRRQITELEAMLQKEKAEFEELLQKILNREVKNEQPVVDILEINKLRRQLLFQSYVWDHRLIYAAKLDNNLQDSLNNLTSERGEKHPTSTEKLAEVNVINKPGLDTIIGDSVSEDSKLFNTHDQQGGFHSNTDLSDMVDQKTEMAQIVNQGTEEQLNVTATCHESERLESSRNVCGSLSKGHAPILKCLSATLDAAWTGHYQSGIIPSTDNANGHSDLAMANSSIMVAEPQRFDLEDHVIEILSSLSTKGPDNMEDSTSWLNMPLNFYHIFSKNFLASSEKLDTLGEYNPVYVSSFGEIEGGARLLLPVGVNDTVIPVYDDEPTSIIAYALASPEYHRQLTDEGERRKVSGDFSSSLNLLDVMASQSFHSVDEVAIDSYRGLGSPDESILSVSGSRSSLILDPLTYTKAMHMRVSFGDDGPIGKVRYTVTCYYGKRFDALRRICCPSELDFIRSLSRCKKWGAQGGKSNVFFAKTLDDRFIIKQVTKTELESFIKFGPGYFKYLSESISSRSPTCLAKILGIYQVTSKHLRGGKETKMDVLVMENLLFGRNVTRLYDLKGSARSRYNPDSSGSNKVLLDQNLIEAMTTSPIFVGNKAKRLLERAVWNDTSFLASIDVMDYSLLVGVDEEKHELVLGIIDFMRQYTWDKHLETWVKASGILGGPKNESPTVISPKQYKKRFRKAMTTYFLMVPDSWSPPSIVTSASQSDFFEESIQGGTLVE